MNEEKDTQENNEEEVTKPVDESSTEEEMTPPAETKNVPVENPDPYKIANIDPNDPDSPIWDEAQKLWLDRKTNEPLRNQDPGIPQSDYVGKHDPNDVDDIQDGIKK